MSTQAANNVQGSNILDVLKKKMRQTKEEMEKYKEEADDMQRKLQVEIMRREEVSWGHFVGGSSVSIEKGVVRPTKGVMSPEKGRSLLAAFNWGGKASRLRLT